MYIHSLQIICTYPPISFPFLSFMYEYLGSLIHLPPRPQQIPDPRITPKSNLAVRHSTVACIIYTAGRQYPQCKDHREKYIHNQPPWLNRAGPFLFGYTKILPSLVSFFRYVPSACMGDIASGFVCMRLFSPYSLQYHFSNIAFRHGTL